MTVFEACYNDRVRVYIGCGNGGLAPLYLGFRLQPYSCGYGSVSINQNCLAAFSIASEIGSPKTLGDKNCNSNAQPLLLNERLKAAPKSLWCPAGWQEQHTLSRYLRV